MIGNFDVVLDLSSLGREATAISFWQLAFSSNCSGVSQEVTAF